MKPRDQLAFPIMFPICNLQFKLEDSTVRLPSMDGEIQCPRELRSSCTDDWLDFSTDKYLGSYIIFVAIEGHLPESGPGN